MREVDSGTITKETKAGNASRRDINQSDQIHQLPTVPRDCRVGSEIQPSHLRQWHAFRRHTTMLRIHEKVLSDEAAVAEASSHCQDMKEQ